MRWAGLLLLGSMLLGAAACGDDATTEEGSGGGKNSGGGGGSGGLSQEPCNPGDVTMCTTADGCSGEASCGSDGLGFDECQCLLPTTVNIELLGALIGPAGSDGMNWDGDSAVPDEVLQELAAALEFDTIAAVLEFFNSGLLSALDSPDPFGTAELNPDGSGFGMPITLATINNNTEDTFQPTWPQPFPGWDTVPFNEGLAVRVTLRDEDVLLDDDIGVATISYQALRQAWIDGGTHWVIVAEQTNSQLVALSVQVTGLVQ